MNNYLSNLDIFVNYLQDISNIDCHLTSQQELICELICLGFKAPAIAKKLCKSTHTIEDHIKRIKNKTKLQSTAAIVCWYTSKKIQKPLNPGVVKNKKPLDSVVCSC